MGDDDVPEETMQLAIKASRFLAYTETAGRTVEVGPALLPKTIPRLILTGSDDAVLLSVYRNDELKPTEVVIRFELNSGV